MKPAPGEAALTVMASPFDNSTTNSRRWLPWVSLLAAPFACQVYSDALVGAGGRPALTSGGTSSAGASGVGGEAGEAGGSGQAGSAEPSCTDNESNGMETGVDCGGPCPKCPEQEPCQGDEDCISETCVDNICTTRDCGDREKNGLETDIDCGGPECPRCRVDAACARGSDCETGTCTAGRCVHATNCKAILDADAEIEDGIYWIDLDGPGPSEPLEVNCDMTSEGGGWTRVAFEAAGTGGPEQSGALTHLGELVATPHDVANGFSSAMIGKLFNGAYSEVRLAWGDQWVSFEIAQDLFVNQVDKAIPATGISTNSALLTDWIAEADPTLDSAIFCRASAAGVNPGGTSWALKPADDQADTCGCCGSGWEGRGLFYGGSPLATYCNEYGGGFAALRQELEQKGGITSTTDLMISVR